MAGLFFLLFSYELTASKDLFSFIQMNTAQFAWKAWHLFW